MGKMNITLTDDVVRFLKHRAVEEGIAASEIIERVLREHFALEAVPPRLRGGAAVKRLLAQRDQDV